MVFTQSEIDTAALWYELHNNPCGGNGADYTASCTILEDKNNTGHPLLWQSGDDETEEGFEKHQIGVTYAPDERFAYIVGKGSSFKKLQITSFSDISDEVIVRRVFCAALRPTSSSFVLQNPIKNITLAASRDTVTVQTVELDELKTIKQSDNVFVNLPTIPLVFGIIYKHKIKGDVLSGGVQPASSDVTTFHFHCDTPSLSNDILLSPVLEDVAGVEYKLTDIRTNGTTDIVPTQVFQLIIQEGSSNTYVFTSSDNVYLSAPYALSQKFKQKYPDGLSVPTRPEIYLVVGDTINGSFEICFDFQKIAL